MNVNTIGTQAIQLDTSKTSGLSKELGKEDFLRLLVTQLRYQNPIDPVSNEEFIAQTAQFSALEQMQALNTNVKSLIEFQESATKIAMLGLIGRKVTINNSTFTLTDNSTANLSFSLPKDATVTATILSADGNAVRTIDLGEQSAGTHNFVWDGIADGGVRARSGNYSYKITAKDIDGKDVDVQVSTSGVVNGIAFEDDQPYIFVDGSRFPLSLVTGVFNE